MVAALASTVVIAGVQVNVDLVSPKLERLNPAEGFKKLFSPRQALEVGKGLLVTAVIGWLLWTSLKDAAPLAVRSLTRDDGALTLPALLELWRPAVLRAAVVLALLGVADQALAHRKHLKGLMMSRDEVKQEHKQQDGDPHHKAKRKSLHKQLASGGSARGLHNATAVVVNPTHIAVALRYDEAECAAPYVVARGREEDALNMRKHAESLGVPVIRDVPLARSLVQLDVGEEVPEELYQAAAAVLKVALEASAELDTVRAERRS
jgi:type III secretion protein U